VLSQRFTRETSVEPFDVYRAVRRLNPSPYMFFFDFGIVDGEPLFIVGSSPEMFVRLEGRTASLRPRERALEAPTRILTRLLPKSCSPTRRNAPST
jgi:anthranilate synthase component 1